MSIAAFADSLTFSAHFSSGRFHDAAMHRRAIDPGVRARAVQHGWRLAARAADAARLAAVSTAAADTPACAAYSAVRFPGVEQPSRPFQFLMRMNRCRVFAN
jgi:hypothetical protein